MSRRTEMLMKNTEYVGYTDLNHRVGFQMAMHKSKEGRYYIYTACFRDNGFNIVDVTDPAHPTAKWVEVGSYWTDEQYLGNVKTGEFPEIGTPEWLAIPTFHAVTVKEDIVYAAIPNIGFCLLDVKDKSNPTLIGKLAINPPFGGGQGGAAVHTAMPLGNRPYAIVTSEGERVRYFSDKEEPFSMYHPVVTQPMNIIGMVELTDPANPSLISVFPYPEVPEGYTHGTNFNIVDGVRAVFGPHNMFDAFGQDCYESRDDRVYNCYFHAGLRIYDVSDPFVPKKIAYFLPPDPQGEPWFDIDEGTLFPGLTVAITEDVLVDDRGYIYLTTFQDGMYIVRCTV